MNILDSVNSTSQIFSLVQLKDVFSQTTPQQGASHHYLESRSNIADTRIYRRYRRYERCRRLRRHRIYKRDRDSGDYIVLSLVSIVY